MNPLEQRVAALEERFDKLEKIGVFAVYKDLQMQDGVNVQTGTTTGTKIGTGTTEKVGFHGITPVVQQGALSNLVTGGGDNDGTARSRCNAITAVLKAYGLIA